MTQATELLSSERDPYLAFNARANLALTQGLLGVDQQDLMRRLSRDAAAAGVAFVELKAIMFAGILADAEDDRAEAVALLEDSLPRQLELGHINLIAQELCPRPDLASRVLRRHRSNGLGPALVEALSHHWLFPETAPVLRELCPSQVATWIDHVEAHHSAPQAGSRGTRRKRPVVSAPISGASPLEQLTAREREVLELMALDRLNEEIAAELFIAVSDREDPRQPHPPKAGPDHPNWRRPGVPATGQSPPARMTENPPWV